MRRTAWCLVLVPVLSGCPSGQSRREALEAIEPPATPTAIAGLNTEWDDYNAAKPPGLDQLVYSTNRGSQGAHLDVWLVNVRWGLEPRVLAEPRPYAPEVMSPADERGPLLMAARDFVEDGATNSGLALMFTSARDGGAGGLDLYWAQTSPPAVHRLEHLSSPANDAYLTYRFGEPARPRALFASDRGGAGYDLYEARWDTYAIGGVPVSLTKVEALASDADDHAPFVAARGSGPGADVVFASKRAGGRGGWDLWCAHFDGTTYAPPVPLTAANSEADEFRPSIADGDARFLVFSSNRAGGRGGYDLYTVRFDGCAPSR